MDVNAIVTIVDDDIAVRHSLSMLMQSVGLNAKSYASSKEFLDEVDATQPGCLIVDVRMAEMNGLELQEELVKRGIPTPVIIITGHGDVQLAVRAMKAGAVDFLEKPFHYQQLLDCISTAITKSMETCEWQKRRAQFIERLKNLTPREVEVMERLIDGKSSKSISYELGISSKTVDVHRGHIMEKMQVNSIVELVNMAIKSRDKLI